MDTLNDLWSHLDEVLFAIFGLIAFASFIVKLTPSQTDDEILAKVRTFFEWVALNAPRTRPPGVYRSPEPPPPEQLAPPPQGNQIAPVPASKPAPDTRPPGSMGLLVAAYVATWILSACAPVGLPTQLVTPEGRAELATACSEASAVIMQAADLHRAGKLSKTAVAAVDNLVATTKRPCSDQGKALPSDTNRVRSATELAAAEVSNAG